MTVKNEHPRLSGCDRVSRSSKGISFRRVKRDIL